MSIEKDFTEEVLCNVLKDYALAGVKKFKNLPEEAQEKVQQKLHHKLLLNEREIQFAMGRLGKTPIRQFLPAPVGDDNGFRFAFFQPRLQKIDASRYSLSLVILFWVEKPDKIFAVRMEPSGGDENAHGYAHMQFTRRIILMDGDEPAFFTDQETWLPVSYPAFAFAYEHPIHFFAGLAISIHGFCVGDAKKFATHALQEALEANRFQKVFREMKRFFGKDWPTDAATEALGS